VKDEDPRPFFQFSLGWLFAIVLFAAVWFTVLVYGPGGSAGSVGLFLAAVALLVFDSLSRKDDAGRGCILEIVVYMLLFAYGLMWFVVLRRFG
jgi:hypothetical protein